MALDADAQHLVGIALPPVLGGKDFDLAVAAIARVLHHGADRAQVTRLVLGEAARLSAAGIGLGLLIALVTTRLMRALLYGVSPIDPPTLIGTVVVLALTALGAAYIPARRAARVDPARVMG